MQSLLVIQTHLSVLLTAEAIVYICHFMANSCSCKTKTANHLTCVCKSYRLWIQIWFVTIKKVFSRNLCVKQVNIIDSRTRLWIILSDVCYECGLQSIPDTVFNIHVQHTCFHEMITIVLHEWNIMEVVVDGHFFGWKDLAKDAECEQWTRYANTTRRRQISYTNPSRKCVTWNIKANRKWQWQPQYNVIQT